MLLNILISHAFCVGLGYSDQKWNSSLVYCTVYMSIKISNSFKCYKILAEGWNSLVWVWSSRSDKGEYPDFSGEAEEGGAELASGCSAEALLRVPEACYLPAVTGHCWQLAAWQHGAEVTLRTRCMAGINTCSWQGNQLAGSFSTRV